MASHYSPRERERIFSLRSLGQSAEAIASTVSCEFTTARTRRGIESFLTKHEKWTQAEFLRAQELRAKGSKSDEIATLLNAEFGNSRTRTAVAVKLRCVPSRCIGGHPNSKQWTPEEDAILLSYGSYKTEAARVLGRSIDSLVNRAAKLRGDREENVELAVVMTPMLEKHIPPIDDTSQRRSTRRSNKAACQAHLADLAKSGSRYTDMPVVESRHVAPRPRTIQQAWI